MWDPSPLVSLSFSEIPLDKISQPRFDRGLGREAEVSLDLRDVGTGAQNVPRLEWEIVDDGLAANLLFQYFDES